MAGSRMTMGARCWRTYSEVENYRFPSLYVIILLLVDAIGGLSLTIVMWFFLPFLILHLLVIANFLSIMALTFEVPRWLYTYPLERIRSGSQWDVSQTWRWLLIAIHVTRTFFLLTGLAVGPFYLDSDDLPVILGCQFVFLVLSVGLCLNGICIRLRASEDEEEVNRQREKMINRRLARAPPSDNRWD